MINKLSCSRLLYFEADSVFFRIPIDQMSLKRLSLPSILGSGVAMAACQVEIHIGLDFGDNYGVVSNSKSNIENRICATIQEHHNYNYVTQLLGISGCFRTIDVERQEQIFTQMSSRVSASNSRIVAQLLVFKKSKYNPIVKVGSKKACRSILRSFTF